MRSIPAVPWPNALERTAGEAWMTTSARGMQISECRGDALPSAWTFAAPEAELFGDPRQRVGGHGAGPFWRTADGSRVEDTLKARADEPPADAIAWLLLNTRKPGAGADPSW
jgi:hypothetical protein